MCFSFRYLLPFKVIFVLCSESKYLYECIYLMPFKVIFISVVATDSDTMSVCLCVAEREYSTAHCIPGRPCGNCQDPGRQWRSCQPAGPGKPFFTVLTKS